MSFAAADASPRIRQLAAFELGRRGFLSAIPSLVELIAAGHNDVEAAEILGAYTSEGARIALTLMTARLDEPDASAAQRLRFTQALAEFSGAEPTLRHLLDDADPLVSATAHAILQTREGQD